MRPFKIEVVLAAVFLLIFAGYQLMSCQLR